MSINISVPKDRELKPRITVVGVGGAGGNAVNNMIRSNLIGCEFVVCNTDAQAMRQSVADRKIQLGIGVTRGLGAGSRPDVGRVEGPTEALVMRMAEERSLTIEWQTSISRPGWQSNGTCTCIDRSTDCSPPCPGGAGNEGCPACRQPWWRCRLSFRP